MAAMVPILSVLATCLSVLCVALNGAAFGRDWSEVMTASITVLDLQLFQMCVPSSVNSPFSTYTSGCETYYSFCDTDYVTLFFDTFCTKAKVSGGVAVVGYLLGLAALLTRLFAWCCCTPRNADNGTVSGSNGVTTTTVVVASRPNSTCPPVAGIVLNFLAGVLGASALGNWRQANSSFNDNLNSTISVSLSDGYKLTAAAVVFYFLLAILEIVITVTIRRETMFAGTIMVNSADPAPLTGQQYYAYAPPGPGGMPQYPPPQQQQQQQQFYPPQQQFYPPQQQQAWGQAPPPQYSYGAPGAPGVVGGAYMPPPLQPWGGDGKAAHDASTA